MVHSGCLGELPRPPLPHASTHVGDGAHLCWDKQLWLSDYVLGERASIDTHKSILKLVQPVLLQPDQPHAQQRVSIPQRCLCWATVRPSGPQEGVWGRLSCQPSY